MWSDAGPGHVQVPGDVNAAAYAGVIELGEGAVNTSGGYERYFARNTVTVERGGATFSSTGIREAVQDALEQAREAE